MSPGYICWDKGGPGVLWKQKLCGDQLLHVVCHGPQSGRRTRRGHTGVSLADFCLVTCPSPPRHRLACRPERASVEYSRRLCPRQHADAATLCDQKENAKEEALCRVSPQLHHAKERMGGSGESCHFQLEVKIAQFGVQLESLRA